MNQYAAYGLRIDSELVLPELAPAPHGSRRRPDIVIRLGSVDASQAASDDVARFAWDEVGRFEARGGTDVIADLNADVDPEMARLPLLGLVLGSVLLQRGFVVLHASAVSVEGRVVAFLGHKGFGKSTMAAAMHARGHALLADDLLAVRLSGDDAPVVWPGFPVLKLWPDAVAPSLGTEADALPVLHDRVTKRKCTVAPDVSPLEPMPLSRLYILKRGPALDVKPVLPVLAFVALQAFSYHLPDLRDRLAQADRAATPVSQYAALAERVPVRHLVRPTDLDALPSIVDAIERDVCESNARETVPRHESTTPHSTTPHAGLSVDR